jgi:hypothetical protein
MQTWNLGHPAGVVVAMNDARKLVTALIGLVVAIMIQTPAIAKGPLDVIEVSGPQFEHALALLEGDALLDFNPWAQRFLEEQIEAPVDVGEPLTVTMYLDDASGTPQPVYRFSYYPNPSGGSIYLPGPGDSDYDLNKTTILSANDGRWFAAAPEWDAFYESLVRIQPPSTGSGGLK